MDLNTVLMMIVLSSFTLAALTGLLGQKFWQDGCWSIALSLALFGLAYACLSSLASSLRVTLVGVGYVVFSCAFSATTAALQRFYRIPLHSGWLLLGPLFAGLIYTTLLEQPEIRTRCISALLVAQNLWVIRLIMLRGMKQMNRGEVVHLIGVTIMTSGLLFRVVHPDSSLSALTIESSANAVLIPFAGFFVAIHCKAVGFVMMAHSRVQLHLQHMADEDSLTGLPNRCSVMLALQQAHASALKHHGTLAVLLMDIDHFKRVNDECGHPTGDKVLAAMGQILRQQLRPLSIAGRYGGEEFIVVCPQTSAEEAMQLAGRLCDTARAELRAKNAQSSWPVTISVGISIFSNAHPHNDDGGSALLQQADQALYQAKHAGRDQVRMFDAATYDEDFDSLDFVNLGLEAIHFPKRLVVESRAS